MQFLLGQGHSVVGGKEKKNNCTDECVGNSKNMKNAKLWLETRKLYKLKKKKLFILDRIKVYKNLRNLKK